MINDCVWDDDDGSFAPNSGAFTVDSIDSEGSEIHLIKNQNYYNAKNMQIDRLTFKFVNVTTESSKNDVLDMIELGIIDVIDWTIIQDGFNNDLAQFSGYQNLDLISVLGQSYQEISINHLHPIYGTGEDIPNDTGVSTNDAVQATMVRKAMSHLVNREFIANVILNKSGAPASVSLYPHAPGFESGLPQYRNYSIATAKNYMEMAGFEFSDLIDGNNDGDYNDEVDSPFFSVDIIIFPSSSSPGRPQWTEMFANELSNIGVGANVTVLSFGAYANRTFNGGFNWSNENPTLIPLHKDGGFDIALLGYVQNALDFSMPTWYRSDRLYDQVSDEVNFDNWINFIDAEITQLIIDYGVATEVTERIRIVHELQEKIYDTIPTIPIIYPIHYSYSGDTIVGINKKLLDSGELYWPDVYDSEWESQGPELNSDDDLISEQNQNIIVGVMVVAIIVVVISKFLTRKKGFP